MILDTNLEMYPATVVNSASVNPVPADSYMPLLQGDGLHTYLASVKPNGGALWKIVRSVLPNSGNLGLQFNWMLSTEALLYGKCFEFDTRITDGNGWTYPCDFQFVIQSGALRLNVAMGVADNNITWQDTGQSCPLPGLGVWTPIEIEYTFDTTKRVCSIISVANGTLVLPIASTFQNQPAAELGWQASEVVMQKQLVTGANGGVVSDVMKNIQYSWS